MNGTGALTMSFSETINVSSFDVSKISLQSNFSAAGAATLGPIYAESISAGDDSSTIVVIPTASSFNNIKFVAELFESKATSFVALGEFAISDYAGNGNALIATASAHQASDYTGDTIRPTANSFGLDVGTGIISIAMSETILLDDINVTRVQVQNANGTVAQRLTGGTVSVTDYRNIRINMTEGDLNDLKANPELAIARDSTFLRLYDAFAQDTAGNPN
jgi:hypothetical protein